MGAAAEPAARERLAAEVQRRVEESRLRLVEFFMNYSQLDRLAGSHELADAMEILAGRAQLPNAEPGSRPDEARRRARRRRV